MTQKDSSPIPAALAKSAQQARSRLGGAPAADAGATPATAARTAARAGTPSAAPSAAPSATAAPAAAKPRPAARKPAGKPKKPTSGARRVGPEWPRLRGPVRIRLLPTTIFVAVLMLGVRAGDLWVLATGGTPAEIGVAATQAQTAAQPAPQRPAQAVQAAVQPAPAATPAAGANMPAPAANPAMPASQPPPPPLTATRIDTSAAEDKPAAPNEFEGVRAEMIQRLNERREELDRRAREIEQREALMKAAEQQIDKKVAELSTLRGNIEKLLRQVDEQQAAQLDSLVKIYETMKPKEAALIFQELDMPVLLSVLQRMKESKSAPILAAMEPVRAKEVTSQLVDRSALPPGTATR
ncbi:MotE family protein [Arenibaculum pallidiluteum]|uniref:MotE family protein n=1 Tax=Arenibaculum pallidiluteum TaxID=2812559 RepID=UPI001A960A4C|nr:hypothetical protein [Arenibaculum pallidiluteum]